MPREIVRFFLGGLLAAFVVLSSSTSFAQSEGDAEGRARARSEFDRGVELYRLEQWQPALTAFQEAYRLRPHPTVRVNMANCYDRLGRPMEAIFHFERYLSEMGRTAPAPQRREVEASLTRLRRNVGELVLQISPDGAVVRIDDAEERRAPILEPVRLVAGSHSVAIRLDGYEATTRTVTVEGGASATVTVILERARPRVAAAEPPTTTAAPSASAASGASTTAPPTEGPTQQGAGLRTELPRPDPRRRRTDDTDLANADVTSQVRGQSEERAPDEALSTAGFANDNDSSNSTALWLAGGATVAMLGGAIATGVLALAADSDFDDAVLRSNDGSLSADARNRAIDDGNAAADRAGTLALVTDILTVGAVLGAVTTVVLFFTSGSPEDEAPPTAALRASPWIASDRAGLVVEGAF